MWFDEDFICILLSKRQVASWIKSIDTQFQYDCKGLEILQVVLCVLEKKTEGGIIDSFNMLSSIFKMMGHISIPVTNW